MSYKPYPKYKDSGIEWLGEIPEGWNVKPLKRILMLQVLSLKPSIILREHIIKLEIQIVQLK